MTLTYFSLTSMGIARRCSYLRRKYRWRDVDFCVLLSKFFHVSRFFNFFTVYFIHSTFFFFMVIREMKKKKLSQKHHQSQNKTIAVKRSEFSQVFHVFCISWLKGQHYNIILSREIPVFFSEGTFLTVSYSNWWQCLWLQGHRHSRQGLVSVSAVSHGNGMQVREQLQGVRWGWIDWKIMLKVYWTAPFFIVGC